VHNRAISKDRSMNSRGACNERPDAIALRREFDKTNEIKRRDSGTSYELNSQRWTRRCVRTLVGNSRVGQIVSPRGHGSTMFKFKRCPVSGRRRNNPSGGRSGPRTVSRPRELESHQERTIPPIVASPPRFFFPKSPWRDHSSCLSILMQA